jgi:hypothetical protein
MVFVDGENFAKRAAEVAGSVLQPGPHYQKDVFVWLPGVAPKAKFLVIKGGLDLEERSLRAHYFTAVQGDDVVINQTRDRIRNCGFQAEVFKKRDGKAKQVDIALASRMVLEAARDNYDIALLFAGDEDYVPAVQAVKELGKSVYLIFFDAPGGGLASELRRVSDSFFNVQNFLVSRWQSTTPTVVEYLSTGATGLTT